MRIRKDDGSTDVTKRRNELEGKERKKDQKKIDRKKAEILDRARCGKNEIVASRDRDLCARSSVLTRPVNSLPGALSISLAIINTTLYPSNPYIYISPLTQERLRK